MNIYIFWTAAALAAVTSGLAERAAGQVAPSAVDSPLTIERAVELALEGNRSLLARRARTRVAEAEADAAGAFLWPAVQADAGLVRSDDPVAAFGARLRHGRFTREDFAPAALNHPDPVSDWSAGVGVSWSVLDLTAWAGREAARARARAAGLGAERQAEAVVYETKLLYLDAVRTRARMGAAEAAEASARATRDLLERRRREGLLTDADVMRAEAALADARAFRIDADRAAADALARLAAHVGLAGDAVVVPADTAVTAPPDRPADPASRSDVRAAGARLEAARAAVRGAGARRLPRAELFGALSTHGPRAFDDRETHGTLGVRLEVPLFTGGALAAGEEAAVAGARAAELELRDALVRAQLEVAEARRAERSAEEAVSAAAAASTAADEARRLVTRRFQEGLATTADLLQAEAEARRLRTAAVDASARLQIARAALAFALGEEIDPTTGNGR